MGVWGRITPTKCIRFINPTQPGSEEPFLFPRERVEKTDYRGVVHLDTPALSKRRPGCGGNMRIACTVPILFSVFFEKQRGDMSLPIDWYFSTKSQFFLEKRVPARIGLILPPGFIPSVSSLLRRTSSLWVRIFLLPRRNISPVRDQSP